MFFSLPLKNTEPFQSADPNIMIMTTYDPQRQLATKLQKYRPPQLYSCFQNQLFL